MAALRGHQGVGWVLPACHEWHLGREPPRCQQEVLARCHQRGSGWVPPGDSGEVLAGCSGVGRSCPMAQHSAHVLSHGTQL